mmetsp:Transcript_53226/g.141537  ORF Transcript_53226/g.141537 Transcript_53226/m.141537 type:complete len:254 (+) Transcript_53226:177-938(+)
MTICRGTSHQALRLLRMGAGRPLHILPRQLWTMSTTGASPAAPPVCMRTPAKTTNEARRKKEQDGELLHMFLGMLNHTDSPWLVEEQAKALVQEGAAVEVKKDGQTAVHVAATNGSSEVLRAMAAYGAPLDEGCDFRLGTPLHYACQSGQLDSVRVLLEGGATIDCQDKEGKTPLMEAAQGGHLDLCAELVAAGACQAAQDHEGRTWVEWTHGIEDVTQVMAALPFKLPINAQARLRQPQAADSISCQNVGLC